VCREARRRRCERRRARGERTADLAPIASARGRYSLALWQMSIWYPRAWSTTVKATVDGVVYALLTGAAFGWLWPR
jgi:hypothetical protein